MRRAALLLVAFLALAPAARPAAAEEPTIEELRARWARLPPEERARKLRLYEERWGRLTEEERNRRLAVFRDQLKDLTPEQRRELLERLREVKRREDLEALRGRREKARGAEKDFPGKLPAALRERVKALPPPLRAASRRFYVERTVETVRDGLLAGLSPEQRALVGITPAKQRMRRLAEIRRERLLAAMAPEQRDGVLALPEAERRRVLDERLGSMDEALLARAHDQAQADLARILEGSPQQAERAFAAARLLRSLRSLGLEDAAAAHRLAGAPGPLVKSLLRDLRALRTPPERRERLAAFLASLPE